MRAKASVLDIAAPMNVDALGTLGGGADAISAVIVVGETAAGPAQDRNAKDLKILDCLFAVAVDVGNARVLADPQSAIHTGAEVLDKVAMKFRPHDSNLRIGANRDAARGRRWGRE